MRKIFNISGQPQERLEEDPKCRKKIKRKLKIR